MIEVFEESSESINEIAEALSKAQGELGSAKTKSNNPFYNRKYANLAEVIITAKEPLFNNGLSICQLPSFEDGMVKVKTILMHKSGQYISSILSLIPQKRKDKFTKKEIDYIDPQLVGACISFARRYSYASILGIPQEDDDGNSHVKNNEVKTTKAKPAVKEKIETATEDQTLQAKTIIDSLDKCKDVDELLNISEMYVNELNLLPKNLQAVVKKTFKGIKIKLEEKNNVNIN